MTRPEVRRAAGLVAVAVVLALVCTGLGYWQWLRHEHRSAAIALVLFPAPLRAGPERNRMLLAAVVVAGAVLFISRSLALATS